MPSRLGSSRARSMRRSSSQRSDGVIGSPGAFHSHLHSNLKPVVSNVKLDDLVIDDDANNNDSDSELEHEWEPVLSHINPETTLEEVRTNIQDWEEDLVARGRPISGRTLVVVHCLPYVCSLHKSKGHSTSFDTSYLSETLPDGSTEPTREPTRVSTPLEIQPGDPILRPRALHAPTTDKLASPTASYANVRNAVRKDPPGSTPASRAPSPEPHQRRTPSNPGGLSSLNLNMASLALNSVQEARDRDSRAGSAIDGKGDASPAPAPAPATAPTGNPDPTPGNPPRWILHPRRGHSALNSGLKSLAWRKLTVIGRPDEIIDGETSEPINEKDLGQTEKDDLECGLADMAHASAEGIGCLPVWISDDVHHNFYEGMCKTYLWPIFHYHALPDYLGKEDDLKAWNAYYETNLAYARKVAAAYEPGDLIWIHDYHLLLVPKMLRELLPDQDPYISLFLHCPFPSSEYFRCLPRREELLDGMLGCNLVCFQTHSYARHFLSSCVRVKGYEAGLGGVDANGRITHIAHCPIGIDVGNVESDRSMPGVGPKIDALRRIYAGKRIIVGRDKLDPTKGVLPKLQAFEYFLRKYPQWAQQVVLIQVTSPSPGESPTLATKVSELVDQINGAYGSLEFQPVHHYHQTIERDEYFALLTVADLALITSIRDGMNTTSMEYVICQAEAKGPLIVSEFTGVSGLLSRAVKVNPWDMGGVARAIDKCLSMSQEEREARHAVLYKNVTSQTAAFWAASNILRLLESLQGEQASHNTPDLDCGALLRRFVSARNRLLLFDYDGTLTPIVKVPSAAVPSASLLASLETLAADPRNAVYIISGRDGAFLEEHLGHIKNLGLSAEHGCFIREPGSSNWISLTDDLDMDWKKDVLRIFKYYEARTQGSFVEKKLSSVTFHYRNADPVFGVFQAKECQAMLESMQESLPIDILVGKKNVEVRPAHTNKGEIVQRLLYEFADAEFVLCAGDDKTDEDMFHMISNILKTGALSAASPCASVHGDAPVSPAVSSSQAPVVVPPPESFHLFPTLAESYFRGKGLPIPEVLEPVVSKVNPASVYMLAIQPRGPGGRMTMANSLLETPIEMVDLLEKMSKAE